MKKTIFLILSCVLEILLLAQCTPHIINPFPEPTNTPPAGFITLENAVPGEYFTQPTFSADNQLIAVGGFGSIASQAIESLYVIDFQSKNPVYTFSEELIDTLSLSPDGNQIAITGGSSCNDPAPNGSIFLLDLIRETSTQITCGNFPTWSPDGRQLAFSYIVDLPPPDEPLHLQLKIRDMFTGQEKVVFENFTGGHILEIVWSPNGKLIAFTLQNVRSFNPGDVFVLNLENESLRQLTTNQSTFSINFSPDSSKILHMIDLSPTDFGGVHLFVTDLEGNCHQLPDSLLIDGANSVTLSPDGSWIAFDTNYDGMLIAETELALGKNFWTTGNPC